MERISNVAVATWYQVKGTKISKVSPYDEKFKDTAHLNVTVKGNRISYIAKNAIFVRNLYKGKVSENIIHDTATTCKAGNTIVTSYVDSTVVESNEGYKNMASKQGDGKFQDGAMLDADLQSKDVLFQYNYSHENSFGLFLNCNAQKSTDSGIKDIVTVRYNLSLNDQGNKGILYVNYYVGRIDFYNNTILTSKDGSPILLEVNDDRKLRMFNNIFYSYSPSSSIKIGNRKGIQSEKNLFYSRGVIDNIKNLPDILSFDPKPEKEIESNVCSISKAIGYARMTDNRIYNPDNVVSSDVETKDILGHDNKPSLGCINRLD